MHYLSVYNERCSDPTVPIVTFGPLTKDQCDEVSLTLRAVFVAAGTAGTLSVKRIDLSKAESVLEAHERLKAIVKQQQNN